MGVQHFSVVLNMQHDVGVAWIGAASASGHTAAEVCVFIGGLIPAVISWQNGTSGGSVRGSQAWGCNSDGSSTGSSDTDSDTDRRDSFSGAFGIFGPLAHRPPCPALSTPARRADSENTISVSSGLCSLGPVQPDSHASPAEGLVTQPVNMDRWPDGHGDTDSNGTEHPRSQSAAPCGGGGEGAK